MTAASEAATAAIAAEERAVRAERDELRRALDEHGLRRAAKLWGKRALEEKARAAGLERDVALLRDQLRDAAEVANRAEERAARAEREMDEAREANARLHRRCQLAESVASQNVEACRRAGGSLGRSLANWAAQHENEKRRRLASRARRLLARARMGRDAWWLAADALQADRDTARAEAARYRAALERIAKDGCLYRGCLDACGDREPCVDERCDPCRARAALAGKSDEKETT